MLNNHTYYSLRYGAVSPEDWLTWLAESGWKYAVITDINCTAGILDVFRQGPKHGLQPVAGIDFRNGAQQLFVGLALNNEGFMEMTSWLSEHLHAQSEMPERAPAWKHVAVIYPFHRLRKFEKSKTKSDSQLPSTENLKAHEWVGLGPRDLPELRLSAWRHKPEKLVAMHTSTFRQKRDFNAHRLLRAIDNNTLLSKLPKTEEGNEGDLFMTPLEMAKAYEEFPFLMDQAHHLLEKCSAIFEFGSDQHQNQMSYTGDPLEDEKLIRLLCEKGLDYRYPAREPHVMQRLEKELQIIQEKGFIAYFLINWDITAYARKRGFFYVGRGSGANSIVAYLMQITDVDPIELDLYFERFINLFRQNPPDFDIDFSWRDREAMTEYIFSKFKNAALLGAFVTFQYSAVVRELGKVFGLPKEDIDMLSDRKFKEEDLDSLHKLVLYYSHYIHGFPNYIGIHAAGILITEKPTHYFGATFLPPKGFPTVQFDMHQAEDVGINKLDILSQRGLAKIHDAIELIQKNQPEKANFDIHDVRSFKLDPRCNELLRTAQAIGCFYVESPAMRMLLTKLQTHNYIGLVAASSVIRPGVSSSGMMREYILRERIPDRRKEAPKPLLDLMPETYGVMVYQEDVIKVAHYFAGLSLGEADVLRRGMSGKFRGREEFEHAKKKFYSGAIERGHSDQLVREVWRQVESFAGYAFAKGHSASYAVESYQCLFLKAYFPLEYMTATVNNFGGFYRTEIYIHEARLMGAQIEAPCVNRSQLLSDIDGDKIIIGFQHIKGLEYHVSEDIAKARQDGPFTSLHDFMDRVSISLEQAVLLARVSAFRFTGLSKKEILWKLHFRLTKAKSQTHEAELFATENVDFTLPDLTHHWLEDAYDELELLGFPLCNPFALVAEDLESVTHVLAKDFKKFVGRKITTLGYLTTLKPTRTSKGESMIFGTFLDMEGQFIDTVHFPPTAKAHPVHGWGLFYIEGKVCEEFDALSIEVSFIRKMKLFSDPRLDDKQAHPALQRKNAGTDKWVNRYLSNE